ncbi:MAG: inositol-3-phosphate synthase [Candidatus Omnitrophica bacterium]|nr:inositol-3-phosphate synthase [Candidatus Omnitrophota bacterium]
MPPRKNKKPIRIAIAGMGNCASSLLQGIHYYSNAWAVRRVLRSNGLLHPLVGPYSASDIQVVAAFDIDERKVGKTIPSAAAALPNCTTQFIKQFPRIPIRVQMGPPLDGVAAHMQNYPSEQTFVVSKAKPVNLARVLERSGAEILLNYLPVGSQKAAEAYASACLSTGVSLLNCIPVFIASDPGWANRFKERGIPIVGDDVKGQVGATILHRTLARLFMELSKTEAVQSVLMEPLKGTDIHIGPSDYVPWQKDRKICFLRIEGRGFGDCPIELEARLSVEDSPNSAGVTIDAIRCLRLARERRLSGPLLSVSAWTMKHPLQPMTDEEARHRIEQFIRGMSDH